MPLSHDPRRDHRLNPDTARVPGDTLRLRNRVNG